MRSHINTKGWRLRETTKGRDFKTKLVFIVHLLEDDQIDSKLRWEAVEYGDIILLPPTKQSTTSTISLDRTMGERLPVERWTTTTSTTSTTTTTTTTITTITTETLSTTTLRTSSHTTESLPNDKRKLVARDFSEEFDGHGVDESIKFYDVFGQVDGSIDPKMTSIQSGLLRWAGHADSRYIMLLYSDNVFINLFAFEDFLNDLAEGNLYWKVNKTVSLVVGFPMFGLNSEPFTYGARDKEEESTSVQVREIIKKPIKFSDLHSIDGLNGMLITRDLVKYLFSPGHPIFIGSRVKSSHACRHRNSGTVHENSGASDSYEHLCMAGFHHPIIKRLKHNPDVFMNDGDEVLHFPNSFNYSAVRFSQISTTLSSVFPSIARTKSCQSGMSALPSAPTDAEIGLIQSFRKVLMISDVPCVTAMDALGTWTQLPFGIPSENLVF